jgi:hypothetical protein
VILRSLLIAMLTLTATRIADACPFCSAQGTTLSGEVSEATFIVLGKLANPRRDPMDFNKGYTDLIIETVIKPDDYLTGKTTLVLPRYVPIDEKAKPTKFIVFCKLHTPAFYTAAAGATGAVLMADPRIVMLDAYRGEAVDATSKLGDYLKGAIASREKPMTERLRYFFDHLDAPDLLISTDAMNEFAYAEYKDVRTLAESLPAAKVLGWIKDPNTPQSRLGLYGLLMGHCGKPSDATALRTLLDMPENRFAGGLDGILAAYTLLDPKAGWAYLNQLIDDPKSDFQIRYAVLKVFRFFWESRPDVVKPETIITGMMRLVALPDMADLPMEDLRKWERWELTDKILSYTESAEHNKAPIVRRSILRFAIAAPANQAKAKEYVEKIRKEDPDRVKYVEQTLKDEITPVKTTGKKGC